MKHNAVTKAATLGEGISGVSSEELSLINAYAPFNRLNFTGTVSLPSYLKQLGYSAAQELDRRLNELMNAHK